MLHIRPPIERPPITTSFVAHCQDAAACNTAFRTVSISTGVLSGKLFPALRYSKSTRTTLIFAFVFLIVDSIATSDWWFAFVPAPGNKTTPLITSAVAHAFSRAQQHTRFHERNSTRRASPISSIDLLAVNASPPWSGCTLRNTARYRSCT